MYTPNRRPDPALEEISRMIMHKLMGTRIEKIVNIININAKVIININAKETRHMENLRRTIIRQLISN